MTAREYLDGFSQDQRLAVGGYYTQEPLAVEPNDTVGVVLLNLGGPSDADDVAPFLYSRLMDPAALDLPLPSALRERVCRLYARRRARTVRKGFEQVGGCSPLNRHTSEQAHALEARLNDRFGTATGARFRTYVAMRHGEPSSATAQRQLAEDQVSKVVLLPLYPHYSKTTTGSSLLHWQAAEKTHGRSPSATALVYEYAAHPKYVQALSERIDEGLQRFPRVVRDRVQLVFSAQGTPLKELTRRNDPYCCLTHATVQQVMGFREGHDAGRAFHVAFQGQIEPIKWLTPSTADTLEDLAESGETAVLIVPVSCVSERVETAFDLDIALRARSLALGIEHFEVTSGLNCHPLFIEALAECVAAQVAPSVLSRGDGADALPSALPALPRYEVSDRTVRCHRCPFVTEARDWSGEPAVRVPAPVPAAPVPSRAA